MKKLFLSMLLLCMAAGVSAAPADPRPKKFTQPDGSVVTVKIRGDEDAHYYLTADGYLLKRESDVFYYGILSDLGVTVSSGIVAHDPDSRSTSERALLESVDMALVYESLEREANDAAVFRAASRVPGKVPTAHFPTIGSPKALVVLAEYADVKFNLADPAAYFHHILCEKGASQYGATGSANEYFLDSSMGAFDPQFDIVGPITLPEPMAYYGANGLNGDDVNPWQMVIDACRILDPTVDFSQYDTDGDGNIDNVYLFYAGRGEASGGSEDSVWPHAYNVNNVVSEPLVFDGVILGRYACSNEWEGTKPDGIGTFVHEFSHVLGLPDMYATSYTGSFTPGTWCVMDIGEYNNDSRTPPYYSAFERNAMGWIDLKELTEPIDITLHPVYENDGYLLRSNLENEFFVVENRQQEGWDTYIPGHGMLVWHIDYSDAIWTNNTVNNVRRHLRIDVMEADGIASEETRDGDSFPGAANVTSITSTTYPGFVTWANKKLDHAITDIQETAEGLITFAYNGGTPAFESIVPLSLDAADVLSDGFTAKWEPLHRATGYLLSVYTKEYGETRTVTVDFTGGISKMPEGWSSTSRLTYSNAEYSGAATPSLRLSTENCEVVSANYPQGISSVSFWHRSSAASEGYINVYALIDGQYAIVQKVPTVSEAGGSTSTVEMPQGATGLKLEYVCQADSRMSLAVDDIAVECGKSISKKILGQYDRYDVGAALEYKIEGAAPDTQYFYIVEATDGEVLSKPSREVSVITLDGAGVSDAAADIKIDVKVHDRTITVNGAPTDLCIYTADGRTVYTSTAAYTHKVAVLPGIYLVKAGTSTLKVVVK